MSWKGMDELRNYLNDNNMASIVHLHALGDAVEACDEVGVVHADYGTADLLVAHTRLKRADDGRKLVVGMIGSVFFPRGYAAPQPEAVEGVGAADEHRALVGLDAAAVLGGLVCRSRLALPHLDGVRVAILEVSFGLLFQFLGCLELWRPAACVFRVSFHCLSFLPCCP